MTSKCAKCNGFSFELAEQAPSGSRYKLWFVQCALCKAPFCAMEYYNSSAKIENIEKKIESLESKIDGIDYMLRQVMARFR